ncbi:MAG TPA: hypothetical protein VNX68_07620 [Nitrosopumilaceae archaeon]|jgi:hypothetical protein|nr:hypothetical protein [Nitrosopumilaceae archaeon]
MRSLKRIGIVLMLSSVAFMVTGSESTFNNKQTLARGQPSKVTKAFHEISNENFVLTAAEIAPHEAYILENLKASSVLKEGNATKIEPMIIGGIRKYRDVDWCGKGELYSYSIDKRSAITQKTKRLARGLGSDRC